MKYEEKLWKVKQFVEENFDDPVELIIALGLTVEDIIRLLPDSLVSNYNKFYVADDHTEEEPYEAISSDDGAGEDW
jgi:hypothetical protein